MNRGIFVDNSPILSIILPVYNGEAFVGQAIKSVVMQEFTAWELIIIDDGSTDHTGQICTDFSLKDNRIQYYHQKNRGLSAARNAGFRHASGKYVAYLDADDYVEPNYYSELISSAENSGADFVITGFTREFFRNQKCIHITKTNWRSHTLEDVTSIRTACMHSYFYHVYIHVWNKLYQRTTLLKHQIQFDETLRYGEDVPFNIAVLTVSENILFLSSVGYHYICHDAERLTTHWNCKQLEYNRQIYKQIAEHEKRCWNVRTPIIAAGMYLRSCFLSCEKAINNGFSYGTIHNIIWEILNFNETQEACQQIYLYHKNLEFILYEKILMIKSPLVIYFAVLLRRQLKKCFGR